MLVDNDEILDRLNDEGIRIGFAQFRLEDGYRSYMDGPVMVTLGMEDMVLSRRGLRSYEANFGHLFFSLAQERFGWENLVD